MNKLRIQEICKEKGMTLTVLAEKVGISRVGLAKATNGNTTIATLKKIADALEVEVVDLFPNRVKCPACGARLLFDVEPHEIKEVSLSVKELLKQQNMTQKEFANAIGVLEGALSKYINGNPKLSTLEKIADALEVDITALFSGGKVSACPYCGAKLRVSFRG